MQNKPPILGFLLFLEEFLIWFASPPGINTIIEHITSRTMGQFGGEDHWVVLLNPGLAILFFLTSIVGTAKSLRSALFVRVNPRWILVMRRYISLRWCAATVIVVILGHQIYSAVSAEDNGTLMDLYVNKTFWAFVFISVFAYLFTKPSGE